MATAADEPRQQRAAGRAGVKASPGCDEGGQRLEREGGRSVLSETAVFTWRSARSIPTSAAYPAASRSEWFSTRILTLPADRPAPTSDATVAAKSRGAIGDQTSAFSRAT